MIFYAAAAAAAAAAADEEAKGRIEFVPMQQVAVAEVRCATKWHQPIRKQGAGQVQNHLIDRFAEKAVA